MNASDVFEDRLDVALSMINTRQWGVKLRVVSVIRVLQRRSPDGWAYISHDNLVERVGIAASSRGGWGWDLFGTSPKAKGELWKIDRVLIRGQVGAGTRPTAWRINPEIDEWRNVPWRVVSRRQRQLELEAAERVDDRGTEEPDAPRSFTAGQTALVPRLHAAALDQLVPRSTPRGKAMDCPAALTAGLSAPNGAPSSSSPVVGADAPPLLQDDEEEKWINAIKAAVKAKTDGVIFGRPERLLRERYGRHSVEDVVRLVMAGPTLKPQHLIEHFVVPTLDGALPTVSDPASPVRSAAELANERTRRRRDGEACPHCSDSGLVELEDGSVTVCACRSGALSAPRGTMVTS